MKSWHATVLLAAALIAGLVALRILDPVPLQVLRLKTFDVYQRLAPRPAKDMPVVVIDLDEASLTKYGQWPWPRTLLAELLDKLAAYGVGVVGFDIVFPEPDRTSPAKVADIVERLDPSIASKLRTLPSNDQVFAETIMRLPVVLGQSTTNEPNPANEGRTPAVKTNFAFKSEIAVPAGSDPQAYLLPNPGITRNLDALENAARGLGVFNIDAEVDSVVRHVPMVFRGEGGVNYPTLALEMLRVALGQQTIGIKWHPDVGLKSVFLKGIDIPVDSDGRFWVHYERWEGRRERLYIPAKDVLDGTVPPERLKGRFALIGTSAVGLLDIKTTPLDPFVPGVDVHAQLLEIMLDEAFQAMALAQGKIAEIDSPFLSRPNYADGAEISAMVVVGVALMILIPLIGAAWSLAVAVVSIGGLMGASWYAFDRMGMLIDLSYPAVATFVLYTALTYMNYVREQAQKRQVRTAFAHYLSPALVEQLADHPEQLKLGGDMRAMTVLFSDIRGFTSISELYKADPSGLVHLINRFLTPMTDLIMSKGGTIDKYMGDCIMAFWNAPIVDSNHAKHACDAALAMLTRTRELNEVLKTEAESQSRRFVPINIGIGLNSGDCFVGNMGSDQRFDYSVIGDNVNLASRLEGQSKTYGVGIVIGENTQALADDFATLELDLIKVKGKKEAVRIFTLLGDPAMNATPDFRELARRHGEMLAAYRQQDWVSARSMVADCRKLNGGLDGLYDLYDERIDTYELDPPGPGWDGVYVATTK
jgi:adenylate cyclase